MLRQLGVILLLPFSRISFAPFAEAQTQAPPHLQDFFFSESHYKGTPWGYRMQNPDKVLLVPSQLSKTECSAVSLQPVLNTHRIR